MLSLPSSTSALSMGQNAPRHQFLLKKKKDFVLFLSKQNTEFRYLIKSHYAELLGLVIILEKPI